MTARWVSFDLKSGRRGPDVQVKRLGTISRVIGEATSANLEVRCWDAENARAVPGWDAATLPGASGLLAVDDSESILWGGLSIRRRSGIASAWADVTLMSLEHWFVRRYAGDHDDTLADLADLFAGFVADACTTDAPPFVVDCPPTGVMLARSTLATDDLRVGDVLDEFEGVGLEYTVEPEWTDAAHTAVQFVVRARPRLGAASTTPKVVLNYPGNLLDGHYTEDYSEEHGANDVMAVSSGEGEDRPESARKTAVLPTWPRFERRFTPAPAITDTSSLDAHAANELAQTWDGLKELSLTARLNAQTHPNAWEIGDDLGVSISSPRFPERIASDGVTVIDGYTATVRAIGWDIDLDDETIAPRLVEKQEIP